MRTRKSEKSQWVSGDNFRFHTPKTPRLKENRRKTHHGGTSSWIHKSAQKSCIKQMSATARTQQRNNKSIRFSVFEEEKNGKGARSFKTQRMMRSLLKSPGQETAYLTVNVEPLYIPKEIHLKPKKRAVSDIDTDLSTKKIKKQVSVTKKMIKISQQSSMQLPAKSETSQSDTKKRVRRRETSLPTLSNTPRKTRSKALKQTDTSSAKHSPEIRELSSPKLNSSNKAVMSTSTKISKTKSPEKMNIPEPKITKRTSPKGMKSPSPKKIKSPVTEKIPVSPKSSKIRKSSSPIKVKSPKTEKSPVSPKSSKIRKSSSPIKVKSPKTEKSPVSPKKLKGPKSMRSPSPKRMASTKIAKRSPSPKIQSPAKILKTQSPRSPKVTKGPSQERIDTGNLLSAKSPSPKLKKNQVASPNIIDSPSLKLNKTKAKRASKEVRSPKSPPSSLTKRKARSSITGKSSKELKTPMPEKKSKSPRKSEGNKKQSSPGPSGMSPIRKRKSPTNRVVLHKVKSPSPRMRNNLIKMKADHKSSFEEEHMKMEMIKEKLPALWKAEANQEDIKSTDISYLNGTDETEAGHSSYTSIKGNSESSIFEDKLEDLKKGADLFEEQAENDGLQENSSFWSCNIL